MSCVAYHYLNCNVLVKYQNTHLLHTSSESGTLMFIDIMPYFLEFSVSSCISAATLAVGCVGSRKMSREPRCARIVAPASEVLCNSSPTTSSLDWSLLRNVRRTRYSRPDCVNEKWCSTSIILFIYFISNCVVWVIGNYTKA